MSSSSSHHWRKRFSVWMFSKLINFWPPFLGAGICVNKISIDYRYIEVSMKLRWYNQNYVGTHFGGSMYAMSDPFYMLILIKNLGKDYIVWDKSAVIEFKKPGRSMLKAVFKFSEEEIQAIRQQAELNEKFIFDRPIDLIDKDNEVVATVVKTLYVRKKHS
jgi:hypothetical protein